MVIWVQCPPYANANGYVGTWPSIPAAEIDVRVRRLKGEEGSSICGPMNMALRFLRADTEKTTPREIVNRYIVLQNKPSTALKSNLTISPGRQMKSISISSRF